MPSSEKILRVANFLPPRAKFLAKDACQFEVWQTTLVPPAFNLFAEHVIEILFSQHCFTRQAVLRSDLIQFVAEKFCLYKYEDPERDSTATFSFLFVLKQFDNTFNEFEIIFFGF